MHGAALELGLASLLPFELTLSIVLFVVIAIRIPVSPLLVAIILFFICIYCFRSQLCWDLRIFFLGSGFLRRSKLLPPLRFE